MMIVDYLFYVVFLFIYCILTLKNIMSLFPAYRHLYICEYQYEQ